MASKKEKFIIIDGNALVHRSFHALPPLTIKSGQMVNAVYGFTSVLLKAMREFKPAYIAVTFDRKEKTFRHEEYKEYKATRVKAPDELYEQIPLVKEIAEAFNIPVFEKAGFEADDIIGTLACQADSRLEKIIVTGDMDTMQLVNEHTKVYTMSRGLTDSVLYDIKAVEDRYGLKPDQMIDFKALRGDPSDNIPGVKGIGEKTATELLQNFKTLEGVYKNISSEKIKDRIRELLISHKEEALMSKKLATIDCNAPINFSLEDSKFGEFDQQKAAELFIKFEFKSLLPRLQTINNQETQNKNLISRKIGREAGINAGGENIKIDNSTDKFARNLKNFKYNLVDDDKKFSKFLAEFLKQKEFVFDTETANCEPVSAELLGVSFSWKKDEAFYVQIKSEKLKPDSNDLFNYKNKDLKDERSAWLDKLKPVFENEKIKKYGHNIKYDIEVLGSYGIDVRGVAADSMIISYLLNPGSRQHNLDSLAFSELGWQKITKEDLLGTGRSKITFGEVALEKMFIYSCEDADFTFKLIKKLLPELKKEKLDKLFYEMEMPLVKILSVMETNGILVDKEQLKKLKNRVSRQISGLVDDIYKEAGQQFNINSTQQLREVLFEKMGLPILGITKTKTGLSTGADELEKLKDLHPIIRQIQKYRELTKLMNTYIESLPELINKKTNRLHTCYNQSVTATGRLSSTEPNLQNIPVRTELGKEIRQAFIANSGYKLVSFDYSQIELRIAAHMSEDKMMIKAFKNNEDIHRATAAAINQVKADEVTPEMRREAKAVNFGILYGQGPHGLSQGADIPYARAKEFIDQYFTVYGGIKKFIEEAIASARTKGYTETLFGRKRYLPEINSTVMQVRKSAERMAINTPLQGTAADMIKAAMVNVYQFVNKKYQSKDVKMLLQVHDELLFEVKNSLIKDFIPEIKKIMSDPIKLKIPVIVDAKSGDNWGDMTEI